MADDVNVTMTISIAGGPPQQGGLVATLNQSIQLSAVSKVGWSGLAPTRWEIYDYPPTFAVPAGWETDEEGIYYCLGNDDPPAFNATPWGKYLTRVIVRGNVVDERTVVQVYSTGGVRGIARREGAQWGGSRLKWLRDLKVSIHGMANDIAAFAAGAVPDPLTIGTINVSTLANLGDAAPIAGATRISGRGLSIRADGASAAAEAATSDEIKLRAATDILVRAKGISIRADGSEGAAAAPADGELILRGDTVEITVDDGAFASNASSKIRLDYASTAVSPGGTLEAGKTNLLTSAGTYTLPALSSVAEGEVVRVVHSLSSGTINRAGSDTINAGSGHATDTSYALNDQQSVVWFRKVGSAWRASHERSANAAAGGGTPTQIANATGPTASLGIDGSRDLTTSNVRNIALASADGDTFVMDGQIVATSSDGARLRLVDHVELNNAGNINIGRDDAGGNLAGEVRIAATGNVSLDGQGGFGFRRLSGQTIVDTDDGETVLAGSGTVHTEWDAGVSPGVYRIVETIGSATRTATASGTARTETYSGTLTETVGSASRAVTSAGANRTETYSGTLTEVIGSSSLVSSASGIIRIETTAGPRYTYAGNAVGGQVGEGRTRLYAAADGTHFDLDYNGTVGLGCKVNPAGECDLEIASGASYRIVHNGTARIRVNSTGLSFFGVTPVARPTALTAAVGGAFNSGDATTDTELANMRTRIAQLESKLQSLGLLS